MKDEDLLELTRQKLRWLRLPGMAEQLDPLLDKAAKVDTSRPHVGGPTASASASTKPTVPPPPTGSGKLNVGASGGWCNVTVDGQARGATPVAGLELPAGSHKLTCTTADGKAQSAAVTVPADGVARYKFTL